MVYLGLVSYGIYVWHQAWIEQARRWTGANVTHLGGNVWSVGVISFGGTLAVAALSWHLVESRLLDRVHRAAATGRT
jgi:peptidoglycan/LPS O-acetylase OafA/YrhL